MPLAGAHDDSDAFQAAVQAAAPTGGCVHVPPVQHGAGYVLTKTVKVPHGVKIQGEATGMTPPAWCAALAMPAPSRRAWTAIPASRTSAMTRRAPPSGQGY